MSPHSTNVRDNAPAASSSAPNGVEVIETDIFIVGAGPAGASLACFLGNYGMKSPGLEGDNAKHGTGLKGIMISAATTTAKTPRSHITNPATLECLRDIGLDVDVLKVGTDQEVFQHSRWARSMTGEEFARIHCYGNVPERAVSSEIREEQSFVMTLFVQADYDAASPYKYTDCPQNVLEPILIRHATQNGFPCRFSTELLSFEREQSGKVLCTVRDNLINQEYQVRTKYMFACDGAHSHVVKQLQIPLVKKKTSGTTTRSILLKADLSKACASRQANLHWMLQPDEENPPWAFLTCFRMVKPWTE